MRNNKKYKLICQLEKGKDRNKKFQELDREFGLTEYSIINYVKLMQHHFKTNLDSFTVQKIASICFKNFKKILIFHKAKKIKFKSYGELNSIEGKDNKVGIKFRNNNIVWFGLNIPAIIKSNDYYAKEALQNRIKYCRILRKIIKGKYKYYVQLVLEGIPPVKINKETGEVKHRTTVGKVGIDIGIQTIAISSNFEVKLLELAPNVVKIDKELKRLQRKLDRQRRANNPNNYNENGTIRKGIVTDGKRRKLKWIKSKKYIKTQMKLKELYRKQTEIRRLDHNIMTNWLITLGNEFYVENMNFKDLQQRSKETKKDNKGRIKSKKKFGKSLANKAPAMFLTILDYKLKYQNNLLYKINTYTVKASQYNHLNQKYNKKKLSQRWNELEYNGKLIKIQRDLYSAFLIMCVKDNLQEIDNKLCEQYFNRFLELHDKEIVRLQKQTNLKSMGI